MPRTAFPDPACPSPDEYGLLAKVLSAPHDDLPKLVYADWLEDRDDPRGPFLRNWTQAKIGAKPKAPKEFSKSWLSLIGCILEEQLAKHGKEPWASAVRQLAKPGIYAKTKQNSGKSLPTGVSKFGGLPDLPPDTEWPESESGPAAFIAQWNLEELAVSPMAMPLPRTGLLSIFIDLVPYIEDNGDGIAKVIYTPSLDELEEREPDEERHELNVLEECRVTFHEWLTIPEGSSNLFNKRKFSDDARHECSEFLYEVARSKKSGFPGGHQLLGHLTSIQDDPTPMGKNWELLSKIGPDDEAGLEACDGGTWYLFIQQAHLKKLNFDEIEMRFDTG
jgi:uncharacterized protein (TIGR02996 family)